MSRRLDSTPRADGFRMPGEFEPHTGCWMIWPERTDNWRSGAKPAQAIFAQLAATIARFEPVTMGVSTRQYRHARASLPSHVRVVELSSNDAWVRDSGPTFVINDTGEVRGIDWVFNAWGGLQKGMYFPWDQDDLVAMKILEMERADRYQAPVVLEGGSIHVDGQGTLLTTEECLLNPNRNPHLSRSEIEQTMRDYLGIEHIIWLGDGVYLDETDGHIDNLACFIRPGVAALTWTDDQSDPQYDISHAAYERLMTARDARGRPLEVQRIHQPDIMTITEEESQGVDSLAGSMPRRAGTRLPASYINFYIANGSVIVPQFDDPMHDRAALEKLQALFPEREVVGFPSREILLGGGNIHCITQQQPAPQQGVV